MGESTKLSEFVGADGDALEYLKLSCTLVNHTFQELAPWKHGVYLLSSKQSPRERWCELQGRCSHVGCEGQGVRMMMNGFGHLSSI